MVHRGFLRSWQANALNERVLARVNEIVTAGTVAPVDFKILLTGASWKLSGNPCSLLCNHTLQYWLAAQAACRAFYHHLQY